MQIDKIAVKEVDGGLFNLNDLYKAATSSGFAKQEKHNPKYFMRNVQTIDLINEMLKGEGFSPFRKVMGRTGGTYVCKELVYAYAMWISPEFHLKVLRCFDEVVLRGPAVASSLNGISSGVKRSTDELLAIVNQSSLELSELKRHGSDWGSYGAAIRKVKAEATKQLNAVKAEIQLKLDLLG